MKMTKQETIRFRHPEPEKAARAVWPVFLPYAGCPFKCVYCSQFVQTGQQPQSLRHTADMVLNGVNERFQRTHEPVSLGFFGGTFTSMNRDEMLLLLELASKLKQNGLVDHIRCSTRPDSVNHDVLMSLKQFGLDMIELGIQSFDNLVLQESCRGYSGVDAVSACRRIQRSGFELGIQLMPGLPGSNSASFFKDIAQTCDLKPQNVRLYPCLVLKGTALEKLLKNRKYRPWSVSKTIHCLSVGIDRLWQYKIPVIRTGLSPEQGLLEAVTAGPWHPSLGSICRSNILRSHVLSRLALLGTKPSKVLIPERYISDFWGYRKMNQKWLASAGIHKEICFPWSRDYFKIQGIRHCGQ